MRRSYGARCVLRAGGAATLSESWRAWLVENALRDVPLDALREALVERGVPWRVADAEIGAMARSPIYAGARTVAGRALQGEERAWLERETWRLSRHATRVERRDGLDADEFFERYYAAGTPVVLTDLFRTWPSLAGWSLASLAARLGDAPLEVMTERRADPGSHAHPGRAREATTVRAFCDRIGDGRETNEVYALSGDFAVGTGHLRPLVDDVSAPHPLLDDARHPGCMLLWLGPKGTVTPLHHDTKNVLLCQVHGRKRVLLFPRFELPLLGARTDTLYGSLDLERPEEEAFPELRDAIRATTELGPGDALFLPAGCFHQVRALEPSISLGFSNFRRNNGYAWFTPGRVA